MGTELFQFTSSGNGSIAYCRCCSGSPSIPTHNDTGCFLGFHWPKALLEGIYYNNHDQRGIVAALLFLDGETTKFGSASAQSRQTERSVLEAKGVDKDLLPILGELKKAQKAGAPKIANTQE